MSILRQIDNYLLAKSKNERYILYFIIFAFILFLSYEYLFPYSQKMVRQEKSVYQNLQRQINADKAYLRSITVHNDPNYYIKFYTKKIAKLKNLIQKIQNKKEYIDYKIKDLSYLLYNKKSWANFLDSLTTKAYKYNIDLDYIKNQFLDSNGSFGHVLEVEISANGDYKDLIAYINALEQSDLVVDVYSISMKGAMPIQSIMKVSVWGINY